MSCWIRKITSEGGENHLLLGPNEWDLRAQVDLLSEWLLNIDGTLEPAVSWIADIGFHVRTDASGGGPIITTEIMELCLRKKIEIFLSEYGLHKDV